MPPARRLEGGRAHKPNTGMQRHHNAQYTAGIAALQHVCQWCVWCAVYVLRVARVFNWLPACHRQRLPSRCCIMDLRVCVTLTLSIQSPLTNVCVCLFVSLHSRTHASSQCTHWVSKAFIHIFCSLLLSAVVPWLYEIGKLCQFLRRHFQFSFVVNVGGWESSFTCPALFWKFTRKFLSFDPIQVVFVCCFFFFRSSNITLASCDWVFTVRVS